MSSRRSFLGWMSTSPLAAKATADKTIADLSGMRSNGLGYPREGVPLEVQQWEYIAAFKNYFLKEQVTSMLYQQERFVPNLDPDLAAYKSFSMNAKITFQRQRNVQRRLNEM